MITKKHIRGFAVLGALFWVASRSRQSDAHDAHDDDIGLEFKLGYRDVDGQCYDLWHNPHPCDEIEYDVTYHTEGSMP